MQKEVVHKGIEDYVEYQKVLEGNKSYVKKKLYDDPFYFTNLAKGQQPKYLLIGCSDSRAPPNEITETEPGSIFIHRNIANLFVPTDLNLNCVMQYAVEHLKVKNIIVMGHTCCGGVKAAMKQDSVGSLLDLWLNNIKLTYEKYQDLVDSFDNEDDKANCLSCMNIREQVMNVWRSPIIQKSWQNGHPVMVHGWIFRVETGYIEELYLEDTIQDMGTVFSLKFTPKERESLIQRDSQYQFLPALSAQNLEAGVSPRMSAVNKFHMLQTKLEFTLKKFETVEEGIAQLKGLELEDKDELDEEFIQKI